MSYTFSLFTILTILFGIHNSDNTDVTAADDDMTSPQSLQFDFGTIEAATDGFSRNNKLGQGGFCEVYKVRIQELYAYL